MDKKSLLNKLKELAHKEHYHCEDGFYSCPMAEDFCGISDDFECDCGANEHNAEVERIFEELNKEINK